MSAAEPGIRYVTGGTVQADGGVYVERSADTKLLHLCREGAFAYVLTSRQMGKSSLMVRTAETLLEEGVKPVIIDLTELGASSSPDQWYLGVLVKIAEQLELHQPVPAWWTNHQHLGIAHRFNLFLTDVVLSEIPERIVVFVDEIDTTLRLKFTDDFFASIRYLYNTRATNKDLFRLSFVLLGVAAPGDLIKDPERTPFNIGQRMDLADFTEDEAVHGLHASRELVQSVFQHTGGHPYLTLRVFRSLAEKPLGASSIEARIQSLFFGEQAVKDSNLQFVRDMLTKQAPDREAVLLRYRSIWQGKRVPDKDPDPVCTWLRLAGIVRCTDDRLLHVRNAIYRQVFNDAWIAKNRQVNWAKRSAWAAGIAVGLLIIVAAILAPFAYRERNLAIAARNIAAAQGLTAQSLLIQIQSPNLIGTRFLLGVESFRRSPSLEAIQALVRDLPLLRQLRSTLSHQGTIYSMVFSSDGRLIATGSGDKIARVFESITGKEVSRLSHEGPVLSVAFSPDGRLVATGSDDGTARVFESVTGKEVSRLSHQASVNLVAFSPDGRVIATGSQDKTARIFETATGKEVHRLFHKTHVYLVIFSPDGRLMATGGDDKIARVFESVTGKEVSQLSCQGPVDSMAFGPNGRLIAIGDDKTVRVFESTTGKEISRVSYRGFVNSVAFSPDGRLVATGSENQTVSIFESSTGKEVFDLAYQDSVNSVAFSPDGQLVASGSDNKTAGIFKIATREKLAQLSHQGSVLSVAFSPNGRLVATSSNDKTVRVFESVMGNEVFRFSHRGSYSSVTFSAYGRLVATGGVDKSAQVFESATGKEVSRFSHQGSVSSVAFSPDGRLVAISTSKNIIHNVTQVFESATGKEVSRWSHQGYFSVSSVAFSSDGRLVATGAGNAVSIFESATGKEVSQIPHQDHVSSVAFSPDGRLVATGAGNTVSIFESATRKEVSGLSQQGRVASVAFSPDGQLVATGSDDKTARVFESATGKEVSRLSHQGPLHSVIFSPDGRLVATGSDDKTARVFESATGKELSRISYQDPVYAVAFTPDGQRLAISSGPTVTISPWRPQDIIDYICTHLPFNLTQDEWKQYLPYEPYRKTCPGLP